MAPRSSGRAGQEPECRNHGGRLQLAHSVTLQLPFASLLTQPWARLPREWHCPLWTASLTLSQSRQSLPGMSTDSCDDDIYTVETFFRWWRWQLMPQLMPPQTRPEGLPQRPNFFPLGFASWRLQYLLRLPWVGTKLSVYSWGVFKVHHCCINSYTYINLYTNAV